MTPAPAGLASLFRSAAPGEAPQIWQERLAVRQFLKVAIDSGAMRPECDSWMSGFSPAFSRAVGERGWIGVTWPSRYGGRGESSQMRLAIIEELLAAGAPVAAHWFSDRQVGPGLLRHGNERQRDLLLPGMARGELYFCIGMSEPESGSDLASVRTRATPVHGGWSVSGSKIWTSHAADAQFMLALVRTGGSDDHVRIALTQMIIDMRAPGVTVRPIEMMDGRCDFCEVFLDEVTVQEDMIVGEVGRGWDQVLSELAFERSGPERFLSTFPMLDRFARAVDASDSGALDELGRLISRMSALRVMSAQVNAHLGTSPAAGAAAALVKDLGTLTELESIQMVARYQQADLAAESWATVRRHLHQARSHSPGFTLRGGTNEILRGIVARALMPR